MTDDMGEFLDINHDGYIDVLLNVLLEETCFLSSTNAMMRNDNFQKLVEIGWPVVPIIINRFRNKENGCACLLTLITIITNERVWPDEHQGRIRELVNDWLMWAAAKGI